MGSEWGLSTNLPMQTEPWSNLRIWELQSCGTVSRAMIYLVKYGGFYYPDHPEKYVKFTAMFMQGAAPVPRSVGEHKYYFTFGFFWMGVIYIYSFYGIFLNQQT